MFALDYSEKDLLNDTMNISYCYYYGLPLLHPTASSFQQEEAPHAFSFLVSSISANQNDADASPGGFSFGFPTGVSDNKSTGFSLF